MNEQCKERVWGDWHSHRCIRKAWKDGYCKQHHPDTVAERRAKSDARYEARIRKEPWYVLGKVVGFVKDDALAASFQSLAQYRTALLKVLNGKDT